MTRLSEFRNFKLAQNATFGQLYLKAYSADGYFHLHTWPVADAAHAETLTAWITANPHKVIVHPAPTF